MGGKKTKKMDTKQAKEYIKKNWNVGSGERLSNMLKRYFALRFKELKQKDIAAADEVFG